MADVIMRKLQIVLKLTPIKNYKRKQKIKKKIDLINVP